MSNSTPVVDVHHACAARRLLCVNLNTHLVARELAHLLRTSAPAVLVADAALAPLVLQTLLSPESALPPGLLLLWSGGVPAEAARQLAEALGVTSLDYAQEIRAQSARLTPLPDLLRSLPPRCPHDAFQVYFTRCAAPVAGPRLR